jgi:uncharacterized protein
MFVVDTNILLYAADRAAAEHAVCQAKLDGWRAQAPAWHLTWGIVYEFLRVATHPRVWRRPWTVDQAWQFIDGLLVSPGLTVLSETERHPAVTRGVLAEVPAIAGNFVFDTHTATLMREHGIRRIYTRDTGFHRFPFIEVIDPLAVD